MQNLFSEEGSAPILHYKAVKCCAIEKLSDKFKSGEAACIESQLGNFTQGFYRKKHITVMLASP